ncbi:hypothetical protein NDU88_001876 [Pleurodeles waltl]|uniref:Uncharacterized protein n=1 Tax=Pleurodeles waltl TaxID=8319 RepID=A0AAV7M1Q8_PLEWA|nr:hypothetical protein NDU88_001876 [Pleurodeles waltl]
MRGRAEAELCVLQQVVGLTCVLRQDAQVYGAGIDVGVFQQELGLMLSWVSCSRNWAEFECGLAHTTKINACFSEQTAVFARVTALCLAGCFWGLGLAWLRGRVCAARVMTEIREFRVLSAEKRNGLRLVTRRLQVWLGGAARLSLLIPSARPLHFLLLPACSGHSRLEAAGGRGAQRRCGAQRRGLPL